MQTQKQQAVETLYGSVAAALRNNWRWFLAAGAVIIALGCIAIALPFAMSIAIEILIGSILTAGGIVRLIHAIRARATGAWVSELALSLLSIAVGVFMLVFPLEGLFALTVVLAAFFIASGIFKMASAVRMRGVPYRGWLFAGGVLAFILGIMVWAGLPADDAWVLGLLVGIDMIFGGWTLILFSFAVKRLP